MASLNDFTLLEKDCMKAITCKPNKYLSEFDIYNYVSEIYNFKDPIEKELLKKNVKMILRTLSSTYDCVKIKKENNIFHVLFSTEDNEHENNIIEINQEDINKINMPTEISVINFIMDENITEYFSKKDYLGNNILHNLVLHNDYDRITTHFNKLFFLLFQENDNGKTPIDLINDFKISNFFIKNLYKYHSNNLINIENINNEIYDLNQLHNKINNIIYIFILFILCIIITIILVLNIS